MTLALSNDGAAVRSRAPLPGGAAAHNNAVRQYFVGAGLPVGQILAVEIFPVVGGGYQRLASGKMVASGLETLLYYRSLIRRQVSGIPVPDSYAWARINQDGAVVAEGVYWPDIPSSAIASAIALSSVLSDASTRAAYMSLLPTRREGRVVIRHSPGEWDKAFAAAGVYDAPDNRQTFLRDLHFDASGLRVDLPFEAEDAWGPLVPSSPKPH
jgi:hypothetical protein